MSEENAKPPYSYESESHLQQHFMHEGVHDEQEDEQSESPTLPEKPGMMTNDMQSSPHSGPQQMHMPTPHMPTQHMPWHMLAHSQPIPMNVCPPILIRLQECATLCAHMVAVNSCRPDVHTRHVQIQSLRDCAEICTACFCFLSRNSPFSRKVCKLCARICEASGYACLRHPDAESQMCGRMCLRCAEECRAFVQIHAVQ